MKYKDLLVLVPCHSLEDFPTELGEGPASSLLNAFTVLWHPALIGSTGAFPRWERGDEVTDATPDRLIIIPTASDDMVPKSWIERARREGSNIITGQTERKAMLEKALEPLDDKPEIDPEIMLDFLALGTAHLQMELLTRHMRNFSHLDEVHMQREVTTAAQAAIAHDLEKARTHLGHCFEMLYECRERFYPVDCYLIDLCLVNPDFANDKLRDLLDTDVPVNLLAPAADWQNIVDKDASWKELISNRVHSKTVELVGGDQEELPTTLMALDSTLHQLKQGRHTIEELFGTAPKTWGRKRFGHGAHLPQILERLGYTGALHFVMDDGTYPDEESTQLRWEGSDGTVIDAVSRIPLAADSSSAFLRLPQRMSESMDYDHTAGLVFARWPDMRTPWLSDLRRAAKYSPALGKFVTLTEFFEAGDSNNRLSEFKAGEYFSPNLVHAVAKQEPRPISRYTEYWERRRLFEKAAWCGAMQQVLTGKTVTPDQDLEASVERAHPESNLSDNENSQAFESVDETLQHHFEENSSALAKLITARGQEGRGVLVINPLSFPRTCVVEWPEGTAPGKEEAIQHRQIGEQSFGLVKVPACGFVWLSAEPAQGRTPVGKLPLAEELILRNDFFEVQLSPVTGGIGGIQTYSRSPNRLSQQLAYRFPFEKTVAVETPHGQETYKTFYSDMRLKSSRILLSGPTLGAIETIGELIDPDTQQLLATYRQVTKVYRQRPMVYVDLELTIPSAEEHHEMPNLPSGDPWTNYIGLRFAWKHSSAALTASMQQGAHGIRSQRFESPQYIEIADDNYRTTIATPGYAFHRKTDERMLDTLLITEGEIPESDTHAGEVKRTFSFAVAIDEKFPMQVHLDAYSEPIVIPTDKKPAAGGQQGWFFHVGASNVQLTRVLPLKSEGKGYCVRLLETEGRSKTFTLRCLQAPQSAKQVDFRGKTVSDLQVNGDAVRVEIAPYEICDVEILLEST